MAFILWLIAVVLVIWGIVTLIRGQALLGIVLIIVGLLVFWPIIRRGMISQTSGSSAQASRRGSTCRSAKSSSRTSASDSSARSASRSAMPDVPGERLAEMAAA